MTQILSFIAAYMGYLWTGARFRIVGSEVTTSNGGDALLLVESASLRLRFVCDRTQLMLDFQPTDGAKPDEWYSVDLIRRLLRGERETSALLDESYADFLEDHLGDVEQRFAPEQWGATREELRRLKVKRAKEMFG